MSFPALPNYEIKERKRLTLTDFRGVDTANPVYAVDFKRATAMRNFISINGCNHKRPGWRQIARFKDVDGHNLAINGYFRFTIEKQEYRIVYAGTHFFIYDSSTDSYKDLLTLLSDQTCPNKVDATRLKDQPIQMFVYDDKAYFIGCGDLLVFGIYNNRPELRRVFDDEDTYIPRTTTNIGPNEADTDGEGQPVLYAKRQTDRDVNVLTRFRINELIGSAYASTEAERSYNLDATDIDSHDFSVKVRAYDSETGITSEHDLVVGAVDAARTGSATEMRNLVLGDDISGATISFNTAVTTFGNMQKTFNTLETTFVEADNFRVFARATDSSWNEVRIYSKVGTTETLRATATRASSIYRYVITWEASTTVTLPADANIVRILYKAEAGYWNITAELPQLERKLQEIVIVNGEETTVDWGYIDFHAGKLTLIKPAPSIAGEPNITVKFSKFEEAATERVLCCRFGTLFGVRGNTNTLFLSGNPDARHLDFWSTPEDFTYFPSGNVCTVGTANAAVMGYLRLGDDSLAILKEESKHEPTLYIRTGTAASVDSSSVVTDGYFVTSGKYITQGAISENSMAMLAGDALFLSKLGVYGIAISSDSIAVEQRVAKERSRLIDKLLASHENLASAAAIVYDNRYYLAIDGAVYVADARYKFTTKGDMDDTYNYEWWPWDNCPVRRFYEIDHQLCFGTDDGRICVFDKEYTDRKYEQFTSATFDAEHNRVYIDGSVALASDDLAYLKGDSVYRLLFAAEDMTVADDKITVSAENILKVAAGQIVYADTVSGTGLSVNTAYVIDEVDAGGCWFTLNTTDGEAVAITAADFRLLCNISGEVFKVTVNKDENESTYFTAKNLYSGETYSITPYDGNPTNAKVFKYIKTNVVAEWYTPVMDMGANDYVKQLLQLTIATEQVTNGNIKFGWETKSVNGVVDLDAKGLDVFDFSNLNFDRFAFDTGFSSSYTRKVKASFNFIIFRFISDNEYDACIYSFTIGYKINRRNKGVF